jgi:glucose-6-phosphate 1-epimerase
VASEAIGRGFESLRARQNTLMNFPVHTLQNAFGQLTVSEYGGQLLSWKSADGIEQLYTPETLQLQQGKALRGGVPVCFPQFSGRGKLPKHGLVRTRPWRLLAKTETALILSISDDAETHAIWPTEFDLIQTIILDERGLSMALDVHNRSGLPIVFSAALHTYLRVHDVTTCALHGLHACDYEDAADDGRYKTQHGDLHIVGEVDRVFADAPKSLHLKRNTLRQAQGANTDLCIEQGGFNDTVVWCPGPAIAASFTDMPAEDWQRMLCIEAAAAAQPVTLLAGGHWQGWQRLNPIA